jgi:hypothetical protein
VHRPGDDRLIVGLRNETFINRARTGVSSVFTLGPPKVRHTDSVRGPPSVRPEGKAGRLTRTRRVMSIRKDLSLNSQLWDPAAEVLAA